MMGSDVIACVDGWLPAWLPDETLYSWCSRYHQTRGNRLAATTCAQLFDDPRRGYAHDFPAGIDLLVQRTGGVLGDADTLVRRHTLLPFFLPWHPLDTQRHAVAALRATGCGSLKYRLGLLTSRFGAHHPLRACDECRRDDARNYGMPYWRRAHQCPGVYVCPHHQTPLRTARVKSNGVGRFHFFLPEDRYLAPVPRFDRSAHIALARLGRCAVEVLGVATDTTFDPARLATTYCARAGDMQLTRGDHSLALTRLASAYAAATAPLACVADLAPALGDADTVGERIARLFRVPRGRTHPLRHLVLIACFFPSWPDFIQTYRGQGSTTPRPASKKSGRAPRTESRERFLNAMRNGASLTAAAGTAGIAVATAQDWATRAGLRVSTRPKQLRPVLRQRVVAALRRGQEQAVIADSLQLAPSLVRAVLRTEVGLREQWHAAQVQARRAHWRRALRTLRMRHPAWRRKELRKRFKAGYAWLRRHDREWLERALPRPTPRGSGGNHSHLDWGRRDRTLRASLIAWSNTINAARLRTRFLPWQLCQAVPALRTQRRHLDRLPLTRVVLRRLLR